MSNEVYRAWQPAIDTPAELFFEELREDVDALYIFLKSNDDRRFCLQFEAPVAYRSTDESFRVRTWRTINEGVERNEGDRQTLLIVENSLWVAWLREESGGVLDDARLVHYAIFTDNDCIEVVTEFPPAVSCTAAVSDSAGPKTQNTENKQK